jgi:hypothetical protein
MSNVTELQSRTDLVKEMAEHLVAAILHGRLDTSNDTDVIECLRCAPPRYHSRKVLDHMDDALVEAKQILVGFEMSRAR